MKKIKKNEKTRKTKRNTIFGDFLGRGPMKNIKNIEKTKKIFRDS